MTDAFGPSLSLLMGVAAWIGLILPPQWQLWKRSGHSPWWSLLALIPVVNIVLIWTLALKRWPAEEET